MNALIDQYGQPLAPVEKATVPPVSVDWGDNTWRPIIREPFTGAWQRNLEMRNDTVLSNVAVFRCISLISGDVAKLRLQLIEETSPDVWVETYSPSFSPVITKPNAYQNIVQFVESWLSSKLTTGNTYVLKERDARRVVTGLVVLNPLRCRPLVADNGDVFYRLSADNLAGVEEEVIVPASEIIHDRRHTFFHPLVGLPPIYAAGLPAIQGLRIQEHSTRFFSHSANPGGFITAPGRIPREDAERIQERFQEQFSGPNAGFIAVLGGGMKYEPSNVTALNSQLIEQLHWTSEMVAAAYGVPAYKVGIGAPPAHANIEALAQQYYEDCLQIYIEQLEACLNEGLALPDKYGVEFDLDGLLRMDTATKVKSLADAVGAGFMKPDEARRKIGLGPVEGGDTPYLQVQNYSLGALARRDSQQNPITPGATPAPAPSAGDTGGANATAGQSRATAADLYRRSYVVGLAV